MPSSTDTEELLQRILRLPESWPAAGSLRPPVLERLHHHASGRRIAHSVETGTGKSTLLLSHLSAHHIVFTKDDTGDGDSFSNVRASPLLCADTVEWVLGATQDTLPAFHLPDAIQLALIDGPHGFPFAHLEYYALYPRLSEDALLVLDDIHIRSVNDLFRFLRADAMYELLDVVRTTAFFRRTRVPAFDPQGDGWWLQRYNLATFPRLSGLPALEALKALVPFELKERLRRRFRRGYVPIGDRSSRNGRRSR